MKTHYTIKRLAAGLLLSIVPLAVCSQTNRPASTPDRGLRAPLYGMDHPQRIPDSYIVVMKDGNQGRASLSALSTLEGVSLISQYAMKGFQGFAGTMTDTALEQIRKNPSVAYVEADRIISLDNPNAKVETDGITPLALPASWGQDRVDQHDLPLNDLFNPTKTGRGVNVYVLDTGIRPTHLEFGNRVAAGVTFIGDGQGTNDCNGHGTHVAGTIGGRTVGIARSNADSRACFRLQWFWSNLGYR